ncbi:MAG: serine O-acetyltransferase EpsC [Hyphomicrobiales bacterium]
MNRFDSISKELTEIRSSQNIQIPSREIVRLFVDQCCDILFPVNTKACNQSEQSKFIQLEYFLSTLLIPIGSNVCGKNNRICEQFFGSFPRIARALKEDAQAIHDFDPAASSIDEVIACYPGFYAIMVYRLSHILYNEKVSLIPRMMMECAHSKTGIEIHPGAQIGNAFFIDHGTGIVIGETTAIHNNVKIYQGVTLGALQVKKELASQKRHPTVEDNVIIYSNATILGGDTVIGHGSIIGGNVFITKDIPPNSIVYHKNEIKIKSQNQEAAPLDFQI